jgi:hypothetical protein
MNPEVLFVVEIVGSLLGVVIAAGTVGYLAYTAVQIVRRRFLGEGSEAWLKEIIEFGEPLKAHDSQVDLQLLRIGEEREELRLRMAELEEHGLVGGDQDLIARVAELEERLDFAERLLASKDNRARLPQPTDEVTAESAQ